MTASADDLPICSGRRLYHRSSFSIDKDTRGAIHIFVTAWLDAASCDLMDNVAMPFERPSFETVAINGDATTEHPNEDRGIGKNELHPFGA